METAPDIAPVAAGGAWRRAARWLAAALLLLLAANGVRLIVGYGLRPTPYPADAYFYLAKAENLAAGRGLTTYWNDGVDRKFFPLQSIALAPFAPLRSAWPKYWLILAVATYLLNAGLLALLLRRIEPAGVVRFAALAFWLGNANVLLWSSVPYAEGLASLLGWSAVLLCAGGWRRGAPWRFWGACLLGGLALTARAEAAMLALVLGVAVAIQAVRAGWRTIPWRRLCVGAALFVAPFAIYWLTLPGGAPAESASPSSAAKLWYVREFFERFRFGQLAGNFWVLFSGVLFERGVERYVGRFVPEPWGAAVVVFRLAVGAAFWLALLAALAGWLGRRARWACVALLGYQALHAFWHYSYGRFNYVVVPLAAYVLARGLWAVASIGGGKKETKGTERTQGTNETPGTGQASALRLPLWSLQSLWSFSLRAIAAGALAFAAAGTMALFGAIAIDRQHFFLDKDPFVAPDERQSALAALGTALREGEGYLSAPDLWLAYQLGSRIGARAWFDAPLKDFSDAPFPPEETLAFLDRRRLRLIAAPLPSSQWLEHHAIPPDATPQFVVRSQLRTFSLLERRAP